MRAEVGSLARDVQGLGLGRDRQPRLPVAEACRRAGRRRRLPRQRARTPSRPSMSTTRSGGIGTSAEPELVALEDEGRAAQRQEHRRRDAGARRSVAGIVVVARREPRMVVVREHPRGPGGGRDEPLELVDHGAEALRRQGWLVNTKLCARCRPSPSLTYVTSRALVEDVDLADRHRVPVLVQPPRGSRGAARDVRLVELPDPRSASRDVERRPSVP